MSQGETEQVCRRQGDQGIRCRLGERGATAKSPNLAQDLQGDDERLADRRRLPPVPLDAATEYRVTELSLTRQPLRLGNGAPGTLDNPARASSRRLSSTVTSCS